MKNEKPYQKVRLTDMKSIWQGLKNVNRTLTDAEKPICEFRYNLEVKK